MKERWTVAFFLFKDQRGAKPYRLAWLYFLANFFFFFFGQPAECSAERWSLSDNYTEDLLSLTSVQCYPDL